MTVSEILCVIGLLILCILIASVMYDLLGCFKWLFHDCLHRHKPDRSFNFKNDSIVSTCKYCRKEIEREPNGKWKLM